MTLAVGLLGLTGLGNAALRSLLRIDVDVGMIWTREEKRCFPLFTEKNLYEEAKGNVIPVTYAPFTNEEAVDKVDEVGLDLLLVSSYHLVIPEVVLQRVRVPIYNFHPSLLPRHRGKTPMQNSILAGDPVTGLTVHRMILKVDSGPIVLQKQVPMAPEETFGSLFRKMQGCVENTIPEFIALFRDRVLVERCQNESEATNCRPIFSSPQMVDFDMAASMISRHIRAALPFPGFFVSVRETLRKVVGVHGYRWGIHPGVSGDIIEEEKDRVRFAALQGTIDLELGREVRAEVVTP